MVRSFKYISNSRGLNMLPYGIPFWICMVLVPIAIWEFFIRNYISSNSDWLSIFIFLTLSINLLCGIVSNALFKSINKTPHFSFFILFFFISKKFYWYLIKLISVPKFFIKPVYDLWRLLLIKSLIFSTICNSKNFLIGDKVVIGLSS